AMAEFDPPPRQSGGASLADCPPSLFACAIAGVFIFCPCGRQLYASTADSVHVLSEDTQSSSAAHPIRDHGPRGRLRDCISPGRSYPASCRLACQDRGCESGRQHKSSDDVLRGEYQKFLVFMSCLTDVKVCFLCSPSLALPFD